MTISNAAISLPGTARRVHSISTIDIRLSTAATGGAMAVFEGIVAPGEQPPLHIHGREDELFHVLEGEFQFWCGDETFTGGPGTTVLLPRNVPHTYRNIGASAARMLVTVTPGGFENFFIDVAAENAVAPAELVAIGARYGLSFVPPKEHAA